MRQKLVDLAATHFCGAPVPKGRPYGTRRPLFFRNPVSAAASNMRGRKVKDAVRTAKPVIACGAVAAGLLILVLSGGVQADGCFVWNSGVDLKEPSQKAVIHLADGAETLLLQVKYEGPAEDFAWIVPLPSRPKVTAVAADKSPFAEISRFTQVRQRYQIDMSRGKVAEQVTVLERKVVGVYDVAVLAATDPKALGDWLKRNGYALPKKLQAVLVHYVKKKWVYVAMRIDRKALASDEVKKLKSGELQPVCFSFASKRMVYPLRISSVNAGQTEVLLYLLADAPMVPATGPARPGLSPDRIVPRRPSSGMDPDYTTPPAVTGKSLPLTWEAFGLARDVKRHLVKYRATYTGEQMTDDLVFKPFEPLPYWKSRLKEAGKDPWKRRHALEFLVSLDKAYAKQLNQAKEAIEKEIQRRRREELHQRQEQSRRRARSSDPKVRQSALDLDEAPKDVLVLLAADPEPAIRRRLATRRVTYPEVLAKLARDEDTDIRLTVARHAQATRKVVARLLKDKEPAVRIAAAWHPLAPGQKKAEVLARDSDTETRRRFAWNPRCEIVLLTLLAKDAEGAVRRAVAQNSKAPPAVLASLVGDRDARVRQIVAGRRELSRKDRARLARDPSPLVRVAAVRWWLHDRAQRRAAKDPEPKVRQALAGNPTIQPAVLETLAADPDRRVRAAAARNARLPAPLFKKMASDSVFIVRAGAARNRTAPPQLLAKLAKDPAADVRWAVARNLKTPPESLAGLAKDSEGFVRNAVAWNPRTPPALLDDLAGDKYEDVRRTVAVRQDAKAATLRRMAHGAGEKLAILLAANPGAPPDLLRKLAGHSAFRVRYSLAGNPSTPEDLLRQLSRDKESNVARKAKQQLVRRGRPVQTRPGVSSTERLSDVKR